MESWEQSQDLQVEEKPPDEIPPDCRLSIEQKQALSPTVLALRHAWFDVRCVSALGSVSEHSKWSLVRIKPFKPS